MDGVWGLDKPIRGILGLDKPKEPEENKNGSAEGAPVFVPRPADVDKEKAMTGILGLDKPIREGIKDAVEAGREAEEAARDKESRYVGTLTIGSKTYKRYRMSAKELEKAKPFFEHRRLIRSIGNFYEEYRNALDTNPDEYAKKIDAARRVGLTPDFLDDPEVYGEAKKLARFIEVKTTLDKTSPEVRAWVSNHGFMKLMYDDIENLQRTGEILKSLVSPEVRAWGAGHGFTRLVRDDLENVKRTEEILKYRGETWNVTRGFRGAEAQTEKNLIRFKEIFGPLSDADKARIEELDKTIALNSRGDSGLPGSLLYGAGSTYGQREDQILRGLYYGSLAGLGTMAAIATGGVSLLGSGAMIGGTGYLGTGMSAAALTGSAFAGGMAAGAVESGFIAETGGFYGELLEMRDEKGNPIDPDTARVAALLYGSGASLLEAAQLDKLLAPFPNAKKLLTKEGIKTALQNKTVRGAIGAFVKGYGKDLTFETATEIAQQAWQVIARESAKAATNARDGTEFYGAGAEEISKELWETGTEAIVQFALPLLPGPGVNLIADWNAA
ncbi:MAG: hypothetical protein LBL51_05650, partial [Synergistaceae bacterium]|nr:hypothetical protein [Synergistaceae bacterium]